MTNVLYAKAKESFITQSPSIDLDSDNIKFVFTDEGTDVPVPATDQFLSDISTATIATSANLSSKSGTGGVFDAADETISGVSGASVESINLFKDTGVAGTSPLIGYINVATGLPFTPSGGAVTVQWDNGASKIFAI